MRSHTCLIQHPRRTDGGEYVAAAESPNDVNTPPGDQEIKLPVVEGHLTCYGFHVWAGDFLAAAKAYAPTARSGSFVQHFLCCQSIELSLKALLSLRGAERKELWPRAMGHNLANLLAAAQAKNLAEYVATTVADMSLLAAATAWYDSPSRRLQYFGLEDAVPASRVRPTMRGWRSWPVGCNRRSCARRR